MIGPMNLRMTLLALVMSVAALLGLAGCSSSETDAALTAIESGATVIDVRTPAEYDSGHVDGALNIDVQAPDFAEKVGELPKDETYVVYCRSGNRSAAAIDIMEDLGFTDLIDGGAYSSLS
ncbi:putative adenylyltransferase/sulfurtransferase MoeZ [Tessaracoccus lapidicaptus]|nr:putative adenylyltransferase/sulfurtransferase MoeZ [Tessaracoccus lapidicaptus]